MERARAGLDVQPAGALEPHLRAPGEEELGPRRELLAGTVERLARGPVVEPKDDPGLGLGVTLDPQQRPELGALSPVDAPGVLALAKLAQLGQVSSTVEPPQGPLLEAEAAARRWRLARGGHPPGKVE